MECSITGLKEDYLSFLSYLVGYCIIFLYVCTCMDRYVCAYREKHTLFFIHDISIKFTLQETEVQACQCGAFSIHREALTEIFLLLFECTFFLKVVDSIRF